MASKQKFKDEFELSRACGRLREGHLGKKNSTIKSRRRKVAVLSRKITRSSVLLECKIAH